ncbi:hypothetical protein Droror1_Dr00026869 [Drosera rotundifolia]
MPKRDVVAVTVLVGEFAKREEMGFAREVFHGVVEGNKDVVAWRRALANALASAPSMYTLGNAGIRRLSEDSNLAVARAASRVIQEL